MQLVPRDHSSPRLSTSSGPLCSCSSTVRAPKISPRDMVKKKRSLSVALRGHGRDIALFTLPYHTTIGATLSVTFQVGISLPFRTLPFFDFCNLMSKIYGSVPPQANWKREWSCRARRTSAIPSLATSRSSPGLGFHAKPPSRLFSAISFQKSLTEKILRDAMRASSDKCRQNPN